MTAAVIERGQVWWVDLGTVLDSRPAKRRPVVIVSADDYNSTGLSTVIAVAVTSNTGLSDLPGNVFVPSTAAGLPRDSVLNVTAVLTLDKAQLLAPAGDLPDYLVDELDRGLRQVLRL